MISSRNEAEKILDAFLANIVDGTVVESEIIECKTASLSFSDDDLGQYFSALSNEANLTNHLCAWMIFGITNEGIVRGTQYLQNPHTFNTVKKKLGDSTIDRHTFSQIFEFQRNGKRIVMMEILAAPKGTPMPYKGHYYSRDGESTVPLPLHKLMELLNQKTDWSETIIPDASIDDLDPDAVNRAREQYKAKYPSLSAEVDTWDTKTFLNKSKITVDGKITNAAILLLGKTESDYFISPAQAKITWILKGDDGAVRDYLIVSCPFILTVEEIYNRIINLKYRYIKPGTLTQMEVDQYDTYILRESLNNAIAHQDYTLNGIITIVQKNETLLFSNMGSFIPGTIKSVIEHDAPAVRTRNKFLATAMMNYKMVDTIGSGIKRMFTLQKDKLFPLPEYSFENNKVEVLITGKIIDQNFANTVEMNRSLSLSEIMMLDKVQKQKTLEKSESEYLRKKNLICGRSPNIRITDPAVSSSKQIIDTPASRNNDEYEKLILKNLSKSKSFTRKDIEDLLENLLPHTLTDTQRKTKINHILSNLRRKGEIVNIGTTRKPVWKLNG